MSSIRSKILSKIYRVLKNSEDKVKQSFRLKNLSTLCTIEGNTNIGDEALIENATGDKSKISIGKQSWIRGYLLVYNHGGIIEIGDYSFVGPDTRIWSAKRIKIGNRVLIAHNVNIHDNISHPLESLDRHEDFKHILKTGSLQDCIDLREQEINIGDDVWIGFNASILKGVTIGKGAIIGANTIITKDVPAYAVVINETSQKIIKYVK